MKTTTPVSATRTPRAWRTQSNPPSFTVEETAFMLQEIEDYLNSRKGGRAV